MVNQNIPRKRVLTPKCYLFWCSFQILAVVVTIIIISYTFITKSSRLILFKLELAIIFVMILDIILFAWTFGFNFSLIFFVEICLILISFGLIVLACFEQFNYFLEEYDFSLILVRTLVQIIRLTVVTTKTNFSSQVVDVQSIKIQLDTVDINESNAMGKLIYLIIY